jgi:hypothetical protein
MGDLKPMEFPMGFFTAFARDPQRWPKRNSESSQWATREFRDMR